MKFLNGVLVAMALCVLSSSAFGQEPTPGPKPDPIGGGGVVSIPDPCTAALEYIGEVQPMLDMAECEVYFYQSEFDRATATSNAAYAAFQNETDPVLKAALGEAYLETIDALVAASAELREETEVRDALRVLLVLAQSYYASLNCAV